MTKEKNWLYKSLQTLELPETLSFWELDALGLGKRRKYKPKNKGD